MRDRAAIENLVFELATKIRRWRRRSLVDTFETWQQDAYDEGYRKGTEDAHKRALQRREEF